MSIAATRPTMEIKMIAISASPKVWVCETTVVTKFDPTTAVPTDEPKIRNAPERPDISALVLLRERGLNNG